jgi:hypothetical protein
MKNYTAMTDEELTAEFYRLWRQVMYYMAAEGNWSSEAKERGEAKKEYADVEEEMRKRGLSAETTF